MRFIVIVSQQLIVVVVLFLATVSSLAAHAHTTNTTTVVDCKSVKCDVICDDTKTTTTKQQDIKGAAAAAAAAAAACCPKCEKCSGKCPELLDANTVVCTVGFRAIRREKSNNECCDRIECISADDDEFDQDYSINSSSTTSSNTIFSPNQYSQLEEADFDYDAKSYDLTDTEDVVDDQDQNPCSNINCTLEKYSYFKKNIYTCPDDSHTRLLSGLEQHCCRVKHTCVCNECEPESKMIEWCRSNGFNFRPVLAQRGESVPGKCCNSYVCHSSNITCSLNGVFYPHNSEWKINPCTACKCHMGHISCSRIECPHLECEVRKLLSTSDCCPVCTGECRRRHEDHDHELARPGESWKEADDNCVECKCVNGTKRCSTETCDILSCVNPVKKPGQCCPVCEQHKQLPPLASPKFLKYPPHCKTKLANFNCSHIVCKYGLQLGADRCPMCQCALKPAEKCPFACEFKDLAFMPLRGRLCKCTKYCDKRQLQICKLDCPNNELQVDKNGCEVCKCKEVATTTNSGECHIEEMNNNNGVATQIIGNGEMWFDGCRQCLCRSGKQYCSLLSCPRLNCTRPVHDRDTCCPYCPNNKSKQLNVSSSISSKTSRLCQGRLSTTTNQTWTLDNGSECLCQNGLLVCRVVECKPAVGCSNALIDDEKQCFKCDNQQEGGGLSAIDHNNNYWSCVDESDRMRPHGSSWAKSECVHCRCNNGKTECYDHSDSCPLLQSDCGDRIIRRKGECCAHCDDFLLLKTNLLGGGIYKNSFTIKLLSSICIMVIVLILILLVVIYKYRSKSEKAAMAAATTRRTDTPAMSSSIGVSRLNKSAKLTESRVGEKRETAVVPLIGRFNFNHEHNFLLANRLEATAAAVGNTSHHCSSSSDWIETGISKTESSSSSSPPSTRTESIKTRQKSDSYVAANGGGGDTSYIYHC